MENLEKHIEYLKNITRDLSDHLARNGKNKSIRDSETKKLSHAAYLLEGYLINNRELSEFLLAYHGGNDFGYQETISWQYVARDTPRFIDFLREQERPSGPADQKESEKNPQNE